MFDIENFKHDCIQAAASAQSAPELIKDIVREAILPSHGIFSALGEPREAGVSTLYHSQALTVLNIVWGPQMKVFPHDHRMWAVIGICSGREDNAFYRRSPEGLTLVNSRGLEPNDVIILGPKVIHSVTNPSRKFTSAIHVYGGDFFSTPRSEWDEETLAERPYDVNHLKRLFEQSNAVQVSENEKND